MMRTRCHPVGDHDVYLAYTNRLLATDTIPGIPMINIGEGYMRMEVRI
jgi:hypothetical protein